MAIQQQQQQYRNTNTSFNLAALQGTGANTGRFVTDVTAVLVDLQVREGTYSWTNPSTGEVIERPQSWIAVFDDGSMFSWPTYVDPTTGKVMPWSRFDSSINLAECAAKGIAVHVWRDERKFTHLEIAKQEVNSSVMSMANRQPMQQQYQQNNMPF